MICCLCLSTSLLSNRRMANIEHLNVLIWGGVERWNRWRRENPEICPDLSESALWQGGARVLPGIDFRWCNLNKTNLSRVNLRAANLQGVEAWDADFFGADLQDAILAQATLIRARFRGSLQGAILNNANLSGAVMNNCNLRAADLTATNLTIASLDECDLSGADLTHPFANGASFDRSNLSGARLNKALLRVVSFANSILSGTDFTGSEMGSTVFADNDLSQALGLETVSHGGPSTFGIDTVSIKGGNPHRFPTGCRCAGNLPFLFRRSQSIRIGLL